MAEDEDFMSREFTDEELSDWVRFNDIDTGRPISIKKCDIEAFEEDELDPDENYKGPYKKGMKFTRIYTSSNFYEVAVSYEEVMRIL